MFKKQLVLTLLAALLVAPVFADDLSVDEIIAKNIETLGGADAWKAIKSAKMTANFNMGGMEVPIRMTFKRPHMMRVDMEMQGMQIVQAYDGETGWAIMPMMGSSEPELMADDQLKQIKDQADFDGPLMDYKDKGHTIELVGKEEVEGTEAYKLKLTKDNGDVVHMYLDTEYFLVFKQEGRVNMQGIEVNSTTNISDYKEVGDVVMPHSTEIIAEGAPSGIVITLNDVELNPEVDEEQFAYPGKPEGEAADQEKSEG